MARGCHRRCIVDVTSGGDPILWGMESRSPGSDELARLYGEGFSYEEIARRFGVTRTSVKRWFRAAGIPPRSYSEAAVLSNAKYPDRPKQREAARKQAAVARKGITRQSYAKMVETRKKNGVNYRSGPDNHMWRGGTRIPRVAGRAWAKRALDCYERDNWKCQDCGTTCLARENSAVDERRRVQAHHIVSRRNGGTDLLENLVTLCLSCHRKREHRYGGALIA